MKSERERERAGERRGRYSTLLKLTVVEGAVGMRQGCDKKQEEEKQPYVTALLSQPSLN